MLEGPIISSLLKLAIPLILGNILQSGYQLIDAFWVGRLGGNAVAAVSVTTPVVFLSIALGFGLAIAGSTLIAQYVGAQNYTMVNHVAAQTLLMVMLVSIVLGTIGYIFTPDLLQLIGVAPEVYTGALGFMRITFIGLIFNFSFIVFQAFMRGTGFPKVPVYIVLGTVILNFILDPFFIFGWGVIPAMGVKGAALATLTTQVIAALIGISMLFRGKHGIHLKIKDFIPDWTYIKRANTIFAALNKLPRIKVNAVPNGTNIYTVAISKEVDGKKLQQRLSQEYNIRMAGFNERNEAPIWVNETWLYQDADYIIQAFSKSL